MARPCRSEYSLLLPGFGTAPTGPTGPGKSTSPWSIDTCICGRGAGMAGPLNETTWKTKLRDMAAVRGLR